MNVVFDTPASQSPGLTTADHKDRDWWRGAVIYQIYPRSYQDSNGDGVGDLRGITMRLPYIADLGADAIWISPFFKSPMLDFGYDVSDYRAVDPMFGTLADFDAMIAEAHRLGLKVMIDQVISHTSDQHHWFRHSREDKTNRYADWYVWADAKEDGTPPNNWLSIFGGSAWEWDTRREQYYLHNFLKSQPDLNFHNPAVQEQLLDEVRFWLDRGVDGFRLDTVNFYFHSLGLEDNPPLTAEQRNASIAPSVNPYNYQNHLYSKSQPENVGFLKRFRALLDEYGAAAVGEVGDAQKGLDLVAEYTSGEDRLQMCYSFDFLDSTRLSANRVRDVVSEFEKAAPDGWSCWAFSNHDVVRHASRWADVVRDREGFLKMTATVILALRGSVCIYQGEELGLTEAVLDYEDLQDPYGIQFWPVFKGRDGCRTPMVWTHNEPNGGFSMAEKSWLPVPPEHMTSAVNIQEGREGSLLSHYKAMLAFRRDNPIMAKGAIVFIGSDDAILQFERGEGDDAMLIVINTAERDVVAEVPANIMAANGSPYAATKPQNGKIALGPYQAWFGKKA
ncbi:MAG: alpha-amylase family glycosyl hydrolase [Pseudomonadota bacterium]